MSAFQASSSVKISLRISISTESVSPIGFTLSIYLNKLSSSNLAYTSVVVTDECPIICLRAYTGIPLLMAHDAKVDRVWQNWMASESLAFLTAALKRRLISS
jgi:hypothetical protein